jgi:RNA polymerase sigma-70 factor (ECF subfamily)
LPAAPAPGVPDPEGVFRQHAARIYSVARRMLGNEADAEDVVQEVLLQVVRKLDSFAGRAELTTWLHRVTVNCALGHLQKNAARAAREVRATLEPPAGRPERGVRPEQAALDRELRRQVERALARLPQMYRGPLVLSDVEGLAGAEIAQALGLSLAAVKTRLHRARRLFRRTLAPYVEAGQAVGRGGR